MMDRWRRATWHISSLTTLLTPVVGLAAVGGLLACGGGPKDTEQVRPELAVPVVARYVELGAISHAEAHARMVELDEEIMAYLDEPIGGKRNQAQLAYLNAREAYTSIEAFRAPGSPTESAVATIDDHRLFERYLDYVAIDDDSGIINDPDDFPDLKLATLRELHKLEDPRNVTLGFHPLAFLLWGEDLDANGPGTRPPEDFVEGGPSLNPQRRRTMLANVSKGLTDDLGDLADGWAEGADYPAAFVEKEHAEAIGEIVSGLRNATLVLRDHVAEPFDAQGDEDLEELADEYGDFSDRGLEDMARQLSSLRAVYTGDWMGDEGPGVDNLVIATDDELDKMVAAALDEADEALAKIEIYDQAILIDSGSRDQVSAAIDALDVLAQRFEEVGELLEVMLTEPPTEEESESGMSFIPGETGETGEDGAMFLP